MPLDRLLASPGEVGVDATDFSYLSEVPEL